MSAGYPSMNEEPMQVVLQRHMDLRKAEQRGVKAELHDPFWNDDLCSHCDGGDYGIKLIGLEKGGRTLVVEGWYEHYAPFSVRIEVTPDVLKQLRWWISEVPDLLDGAEESIQKRAEAKKT